MLHPTGFEVCFVKSSVNTLSFINFNFKIILSNDKPLAANNSKCSHHTTEAHGFNQEKGYTSVAFLLANSLDQNFELEISLNKNFELKITLDYFFELHIVPVRG